MQALITHRPAHKGQHYTAREFIGCVIEVELREAGYAWNTLHETDPHPSVDQARESARRWAIENGYTIQERD